MQYMLLIYGDEEGWNARTDDELQALNQGYEGLTRDLLAAGKLAGASELQPVGVPWSTEPPWNDAPTLLAGTFVLAVKLRVSVPITANATRAAVTRPTICALVAACECEGRDT